MKHYYKHILAGVLAATSLASCNRAEYAFRSGTGSFHTPASQATERRVESTTVAAAPVVASAPEATATTQAPAAVVSTPSRLATPVAPTQAAALAKLAALPRVAVAKAAVKVKRQLQQKQEVASTSKPASRVGTAAIIIGIGLVILLIGGLIGGANIVATIGGITFLVGLILLIIALIAG